MDVEAVKLEARVRFPNMPEEVFEWFVERIRVLGWPPVSDRWHSALRHKSLNYWQKLKWRKCQLEINRDHLTQETIDIINRLFYAVFKGISDPVSEYVGDSAPRIRKMLLYIKDNRRLPGSLIFLEHDGVYDVVDGCHRLTAFYACRHNSEFKDLLSDLQESWVGFISEHDKSIQQAYSEGS